MYVQLALATLFVLQVSHFVEPHGQMAEPPNRASMWRFGYKTPINYDDTEYYCGGFSNQWEMNGGHCGECGDSWELPRPRSNEAGGKYGRGIISRTYEAGQDITATVVLTTNHMGYFEFRLCPTNDPKKMETQECFNENVLKLANGDGTRFHLLNKEPGLFSVNLTLPEGLTCSQCVMQWHYRTAENWGPCGMGCGPQETFRGCADIAII